MAVSLPVSAETGELDVGQERRIPQKGLFCSLSREDKHMRILQFILCLTMRNYLSLLCVGEHQLHRNILKNLFTKVLDRDIMCAQCCVFMVLDETDLQYCVKVLIQPSFLYILFPSSQTFM